MQGELNGYKIEIPDPPVVEGWEAVEFRHPVEGEWFVTSSGSLVSGTAFAVGANWIMRRKPRRRIVFEECGEPAQDDTGDSYCLGRNKRVLCIPLSSLPEQVGSRQTVCWLRRTDEEVGG